MYLTMHSKCNFLHFVGQGREMIEDDWLTVPETATNALWHARSALRDVQAGQVIGCRSKHRRIGRWDSGVTVRKPRGGPQRAAS